MKYLFFLLVSEKNTIFARIFVFFANYVKYINCIIPSRLAAGG